MAFNAWVQESSDSDVSGDENPTATPARELLWAAEKGDLDAVKRLLKTNIEVINATDKDLYTPLHRAAYSNHNVILKLLLHHGGNPSARTIDGWTPLHSACKWGNIECVRPLVRASPDINVTSNSGQTPIHLAATNPKAGRTLKYLLRQPTLDKTIKNSIGETAQDVAVRCGPYASLFDSVQQKTVLEDQDVDDE